MSSLRVLCCLPSVKKQEHDLHFFCSMYSKTIIRVGFCDIKNIQGLGKGYQPRLRLITPALTWISLYITKTSTNNCLLTFLYYNLVMQHFQGMHSSNRSSEVQGRMMKCHYKSQCGIWVIWYMSHYTIPEK